MEITDIRVTLYGNELLKAFVNVTFDNAFIVRGIKLIDGPSGLFLSMPSRPKADGTYQDICHPVNGQMREYLEKAILREYEKVATATPRKVVELARYRSEVDVTRKAVGAA